MRLTPYENWEVKNEITKMAFKLLDEIISHWNGSPPKAVELAWENFNGRKKESDDAWDVYTNDELRKDRLLAKKVR